jgi:CheY-like chemotaxis protein
MDEATLQRATEPFFTTKGVGKGTGLGLSMAHGFAVQSGGTLRLRSKPGTGTTAEIWLPRSGEVISAQIAEEVAEAASEAPGRFRILLVEDDTLVSMSTTAILEDLGHEVVEAPSGAAALAEMQNAPAFDIVITDYTMPGMNGLELAEQIRSRWPGMPIILAGGQTELRDQAGLDLPRLMKPYSQDDLAKMLERLIAHTRAA